MVFMNPFDGELHFDVRVVPARAPKILGEQYKAGNQVLIRILNTESRGLVDEIRGAGLTLAGGEATRARPAMLTSAEWIYVAIAGGAAFWTSLASVLRAFIKKNDTKSVTVSTTEISVTGYAPSDLAPLMESLQEQHRSLVERSIVYDKYGSPRPQEEQDEIREYLEREEAHRAQFEAFFAEQRELDGPRAKLRGDEPSTDDGEAAEAG